MAKSARKAAKKARPKARPRPRPRPSPKGPAGDPKAAMREALLRMVAAGGWRKLSYAEIAKDAGLSLAAAYEAYPSKAAILTGISRDIDARLFASLEEDPLDGSVKDKLFDLIMRRFDILSEHKEAYAALVWELPHTPFEAGCLMFQLRRSLANMLEAAGVSASGLRGAFRIEGLGAIYACALRVWLKDETADLSKTMAELDKRLAQIDRWIGLTRRVRD
ncbi:TetR/AcrR family transcriptional regulator [Dongia deserti]|uniref:TetR/AcrR family transcriptional regulator n=1 Tax=Dongia deserti TaxID=2268030 RepID=UPI0013C4C0EE|nr:TetR/AcrR family transcriptional regulator [Dongia deserti]